VLYVYTSILNGFDNLRPPATPHDDPGKVRYICFTNIPNLPRVHPWEYRPAYIATGNPARDSRIPKILPHLMLPADATASIYHDGNFQLRQDPAAIVNELLAEHDWAAHRHPGRNCIYDEAKILLQEKIGTRELVESDVSRFRAWGHPANAGLWAMGMIVRRHTDHVALLNEKWWQLFQDGCERDQISFPVAKLSMGLLVRTIDADIFSSPYLLFRWHAAWRDREDNPDFWRQRDQIRSKLEALKIATLSNGNIIHHEY
jgi:hypothetical protein